MTGSDADPNEQAETIICGMNVVSLSTCTTCGFKSQSIESRRFGAVALIWLLLLVPLLLCFIPLLCSGCHDREFRCVMCAQVKREEKARIFPCCWEGQ